MPATFYGYTAIAAEWPWDLPWEIVWGEPGWPGGYPAGAETEGAWDAEPEPAQYGFYWQEREGLAWSIPADATISLAYDPTNGTLADFMPVVWGQMHEDKDRLYEDDAKTQLYGQFADSAWSYSDNRTSTQTPAPGSYGLAMTMTNTHLLADRRDAAIERSATVSLVQLSVQPSPTFRTLGTTLTMLASVIPPTVSGTFEWRVHDVYGPRVRFLVGGEETTLAYGPSVLLKACAASTELGDARISVTFTSGADSLGRHVQLGNTHTFTVVDPRITMDFNRNLSVGPDDEAIPDRRYLFWVNDDVDYQTGDGEEIDAESGAPNCNDNRIGNSAQWPYLCLRDLEDFTLLVLQVPHLVHHSQLDGITYHLRFDGGLINVFPSVTGSFAYLSDRGTADDQLSNFGASMIGPIGSQEVQIPSEYVADGGDSPFLLEGREAGSGDLTFVIRRYGVLLASRKLELTLRPIETFYQRFVSPSPGASSEEEGDYQPDFVTTNDYLLFVHGFNMSAFNKRAWAATVFKRLWWLGYRGHVGLFDWPCEMLDLMNTNCYNDSEFNAYASGYPLYERIAQLDSGPSAGKVRVLAHSQGNVVMGEAMRYMSNAMVHTYIASQAAIAGDCYQSGLPPYLTEPDTPNVLVAYPPTGLPYLFYAKTGANRRFNYNNLYDYALRAAWLGSWQQNNAWRPRWPFQYEDGDANIDTYLPALGDRFRLDDDDLTFPAHTALIYSYAAEARSRAMGTYTVMDDFTGFNLINWPLNYDDTRYSHSRQFLSNIVDERAYWVQLKADCEF